VDFEIIAPRKFDDERGSLQVFESSWGFPFTPKRFFWLTNVPKGESRGFHAHRFGHQLLFCLAGSILVTLRSPHESEAVLLFSGGPGVWMKNMTWGEQQFLSEDAVLLVMASNEFDEADYIRSFEEYVLLSKQRF
jgi:UDP-2-acetamido-3-amino-2,3-dideoxy-glucuronate N-acetyltransferase